MTVIGVDVTRGSWIGITSQGVGHVAGSIAELVRAAGELDAIAIDIPIGMPTSGARACDLAAKHFLGPRRSSVFITPTRAALTASTHAEAVAINRSLTGKGISIQAFGLRHKILEVDAWLVNAPCPVIEVHPEMSFRTLAGYDLAAKWTWLGATQRCRLLAEIGLGLESVGVAGSVVAVDDVLDAAAAMWTAQRFLRGQAVPCPAAPSPGDATIWA